MLFRNYWSKLIEPLY